MDISTTRDFAVRRLKRLAAVQRVKRTRLGARVSKRYYAKLKPVQNLWRYRESPVDASMVLYQASDGKTLSGNPRAIFDGLVEHPDFFQLRHVWVVEALDHLDPRLMRSLNRTGRVTFVQYQSSDYYRYLATAGFLINDTTFPPSFSKRPGQVYANTWHGTPLKKMGYDVDRGFSRNGNILRNLVSSDYILSANHFMTETLYQKAFRLEGVYRGRIIEEGYPRIDAQFTEDRNSVEATMAAYGMHLDDRELILYAPTWRGSSQASVLENAQELVSRIEKIRDTLDPSRQQLVVRVHHFVHGRVAADERLKGLLVPNEVGTNELLAATDHLITDYSSIFFDYLVSGRPISFFAPDLEQYRQSNGLYIETEEWPGPIFDDIGDLGAELVARTQNDSKEMSDRRKDWATRFCPYEDGRVTERVIDIVFGGKVDGYRVREGLPTEKVSLLIHVGGLGGNGISAAAFSLLSLIDHDRYDVSVLYPSNKSRDAITSAERIHPRARHFPRMGSMVMSPAVKKLRAAFEPHGVPAAGEGRTLLDEAFVDEWQRCFGDSRFDHVIDFSGYSTFWSLLLLNGRFGTCSTWVHSDLRAEYDLYLLGRRPNAKYLPGVFSVMDRFDHIISATAEMNKVSMRTLAGYASPEKFTHVTNTIDHHELMRRSQAAGPLAAPGGLLLRENEGVRQSRAAAQSELARVLESLGRSVGWDELAETMRQLSIVHRYVSDNPNLTTFVAMGRLSAEKNHARLIRAFASVRQRYADVELLIVGQGELHDELRSLARDLRIADWVKFVGFLSNPMPLIKECDCFVMSSDYEGQGLVVLEALCLSVPVVSTRFDAVTEVLSPGQGLIVNKDDSALAEGMCSFIEGRVPFIAFDADAYNAGGLAAFDRLFGHADARAESPA